jgi:hypothetical protein
MNLSAVRCQWWNSSSYHFSIIASGYTEICSNYCFLDKFKAAQGMDVNSQNDKLDINSALGRIESLPRLVIWLDKKRS